MIHNPDCPKSNKSGKCPYYDPIFGKCFHRCGYPNSPHTCGECAHWVGNCTSDPDKRHDKYGSCLYYCGGVASYFKCNCEHFYQRKPGEPNYIDWVESRVIELGGAPDSSPESRELRKQARQEWKNSHM